MLWALEQAGHDVPGMDLELDGSVPLGGGLSSSASLEAAVAVAACGLMGLELDDALRHELIDVCCRAETEAVGAPTGGLDQSAVLLGARGQAMLLDFADGSARAVPCDPGSAGLALIVVDTRVSHAHTDGGYGNRRAECEEAAALLGVSSLREVVSSDLPSLDGLADPVLRARVRHIVTENDRVRRVVTALEASDWQQVGDEFVVSHASMRDDFEISCAELDLVTSTAVAAGALGARMTGGGFGGSAIALVPTDLVATVRDAVDTAFAGAGFAPPGHLDGNPAEGARLLPTPG